MLKKFIERPVLSTVISILILILGILGLISLPVTQYPDIAPSTVKISASYPGANAKTVMESVIIPIEEQVNGVEGMDYISSTASNNGSASIDVVFKPGVDGDIAQVNVQNRVARATPLLPSEVTRSGVVTQKQQTSALMFASFSSTNPKYDEIYLQNYLNINIIPALKRVNGVGDATVFGAMTYSMRIWLDPSRMASYGLVPSEVSAALSQESLEAAAGSLGENSGQSFQYTITYSGRYKTEDQYRNIVIKSLPNGQVLRLKDVANVEFGAQSYAGRSAMDGDPSAVFAVYQTPGSNAQEIIVNLRAELEKASKLLPEGVSYTILMDTNTFLDASISKVVHTMIEAFILVFIVVYIFLQDFRSTLVPLIAVPVSIIGTFFFLNLAGFSLNLLTLFALVLAIGIVVDDAIVVVEAVQHYIDHYKMDAKEATMRAMKDITAPVIAIALILAAVFVPVGFIPGMVGKLYQQFAITIAVSVMLSAFIALSLTPALCSIMLKPSATTKDSKGLNKFFYKFNVWFDKVTYRYSKGVKKAIKSAPLVLIILVCIFVGTGWMFSAKKAGFIPNEDGGIFFMGVSLPEGASSARTEEVLTELTNDLRETFPEINYVTSINGMNLLNRSAKPNGASLFVSLKPWDQREKTVSEITGAIMGKYRGYSKATVIAATPPPIPGLGTAGGFTMEIQDRQTVDIKDFEAMVGRFLAAANQRPEIGMAYTLFNSNSPNYKLQVDREMAKRMGVPVSNIYSTISSYLGSSYVNDFTKYGRNFRVVTQADTSYRMHIEDINKLYVKNVQGQPVPISNLVRYELTTNPSIVNHFNIFRSIQLSGEAGPGYSSGDAIRALEEVAAETLSDGYSYEFSGLSLQEKQSGSKTIQIFALCILFVFLLLASLYESWSVPFSILLSVPLGIFGAILALTLLPKLDNNIYAQIGLVTIIGLAAKNAILIVEFAKERVDIGMNLVEATLDAVKLRLRPIIMTSLAFILGIIPLMLSTGAGAVSRQTIGWTVFGGMTAATFLAIFIVPVLFVVITRMAYGKKKLAELEANFDEEKKKSLSAH